MAERRYSIVLYAALATAAVATFGVYRALKVSRTNSQVATRPVVVATHDLGEGASLTRDALVLKQWPATAVPNGAYSAINDVVGRVTRVPVFAGEPLVPGRIAALGVGAGLEVKVPAGKRAMAVKINDVAGISGLIQPNSRVDVLVSMHPTTPNAVPVAKLFMENVRVLSVGTTVQRDATGKPIPATTAALEVTPQESERLAVAANEGTIQLVLRGYGDPTAVATNGARTVDVLGPVLENGTGALAVTTAGTRQASAGEVALRRRTRPAPKKIAPVVQPAPAPVTPTVPESVTVTIYRGSAVDHQSFQNPQIPRKP